MRRRFICAQHQELKEVDARCSGRGLGPTICSVLPMHGECDYFRCQVRELHAGLIGQEPPINSTPLPTPG